MEGTVHRISFHNALLLAGSVILCNSAGLAGSVFTETGPGSWYNTVLIRPWFTPPGFVFPVVWTTLFVLMGIALYLVISEGINKKEVRLASGIFLIQLILNVMWSYLFFGLQSPLFGFIEIIVLWAVILLCAVLFYRIKRTAGYLLTPYLFWVAFASLINLAVVLLNP